MNRDRHAVAMDAAILSAYDELIDVRSPAEYAEDHVPGAVSAPVLDDAERARIGTIYKTVSTFQAKKAGAALVSKNIARHLETLFADRPREWRPLVYCWRGGKRSAALAHVLREIGWDAKTLEGGYRSYRRWVVERLAERPARLRFRVVHGATGSGKSRLLAALERAGAQVLDLEGLAAHRGSVLGGLPGRPQPAQKGFESLLLARLAALDPARPVYVEGESKKIGQLHVPDALITAMRESECLVLEASVATRISLLIDEYRHYFDDPAPLEAQLDCLTVLHGHERVAAWKALARDGKWQALVARLLEEHYDPAYRRSAERNFVRLPDAPRLAVAGPGEADFDRLAAGIVRADAAAAAPDQALAATASSSARMRC